MPSDDYRTREGDLLAFLFIYSCFLGICVCGILGGAIAAFVFTCIFLDKDKDKGGSDPTCLDAGDAIWTYVIVRLILGWCGGICSSPKNDGGDGGDTTDNVMGLICQAVISATLVIYGGVVLFSKDVCDQYKNTGLYKMYYVMYWIDVSMLCVMVLFFVVVALAAVCGGYEPADVQENVRTSIQRRMSGPGGRELRRMSGLGLANLDANNGENVEKSVDEPVAAEAIVVAEKTVSEESAAPEQAPA